MAAVRSNPFLSIRSTGHGAHRLVADLEAGTQLDRFVVKELLGSGRFSTVYLAEDTVRSEDVAIKLTPVETVDVASRELCLQRERAQYDKIQDHRHVIKVHDVHLVPWGGLTLVVLSMEYADGGSFRQWLLEHRDNWSLRCSQGMACFDEICVGVAAIHDAGVVHLDLKPENLLFVRGVLKVADFGASSLIEALTLGTVAHSESLSADVERGTPAYMSPEHYTAPHPQDLDARADIYSLGVIAYEICHPKCRPPFGGSYARLRELHTQVPPTMWTGIDERAERVISRCLQKDPRDRCPDARELLVDLTGPPREEDKQATADSEDDASAELDKAWQGACRYFDQRQFNDAMRLCRAILTHCPGHIEAEQMQEEIQHRDDQARRIYEAIEQGLDSRSLDEQIELLREAVDAYPDHPVGRVTQIKLALKSRQYRRAMEQGLGELAGGSWQTAQSWFQLAKELNRGVPEAERPERLAAQVLQEVQQARDRIDAAIADGNWDRALALAQAVDQYTEQMTTQAQQSAVQQAS